MSPFHSRRTLCRALLICPLAMGLWQGSQGLWIHTKAWLAQILLERAWSRTLAGEERPRPWPWADTWPVGRLLMPAHAVDLIVLAEASGRTLAFGPGHVSSTASPGAPGTMLLTGHRDTHFRFLQEVTVGERLEVVGRDGRRDYYRVTDRR